MSSRSCSSVYFQFPLLLCIILILVIPFACSISSKTRKIAQNETDEVALKAFRSKISHFCNSWNDSSHFCSWEGVTCSRRHRRVTVLNLSSRGLVGSLSPHVGNLSFLREIVLYNNSIQGEIPQALGHLFRLEVLHMSNNSIVGEIPANLSQCSKLTTLHLGRNKLVGKIPPEFGSLYHLKILRLGWINLTGGIPSFIGNLTSLESISIAYNNFGGNIPDSLGQLKWLTFLELSDNNLSGEVPTSLYNLSFLDRFSLSDNQLHGSLPPNLGLVNLRTIQISGNLFTGSIPISLSNATKLQVIEAGRNSFSGKLMVDFGGMHDLMRLTLHRNNLGSGEVDEMTFISSLGDCSNLRFLGFGGNQFTATLPHSITNLSTTLQGLSIYGNRLYGSIPPGFANLLNLHTFSVSKNRLTGSIPKEMGKLHNLQALFLNNNQLSGEIPSSLGNLSLLMRLFLNNNTLSGTIPSSFGNLKQLDILLLSENSLNGTIPEQLFNQTHLSITLDLSQNHLVGPIPRNIGNLKAISTIYVSDNNLSGEIPTELGFCSNLEYLYMEGNFLTGSIPPSLSNLKGIRKINLARNNLSGQIPNFFGTLPLENLNLSFNDLEGELPMEGIFTNASAISIVGNNRICGGIAKLKLPKCPNNHSKKGRISSAFKILISTIIVVLGLTIISSIFCWLKKEREKQTSKPTLEKTLLKVSYEMLFKATDGFSPTHLIGSGGFSSVYKGILDQDGAIVAIKVLNLLCQGASKSFIVECKALKNIRHRNLVRVITSCSSIDFQGNDFKAIC